MYNLEQRLCFAVSLLVKAYGSWSQTRGRVIKSTEDFLGNDFTGYQVTVRYPSDGRPKHHYTLRPSGNTRTPGCMIHCSHTHEQSTSPAREVGVFKPQPLLQAGHARTWFTRRMAPGNQSERRVSTPAT
jgi:hypothetical protein